VLGFDVTFQYGDPLYHVCLCRDEVSLHLIAANAAKRLAGNRAICIFVRDVDAIYAELTARGATRRLRPGCGPPSHALRTCAQKLIS
jgi:hypothetical protein